MSADPRQRQSRRPPRVCSSESCAGTARHRRPGHLYIGSLVPEPPAEVIGAEVEAERLYSRVLERLGLGNVQCPPCARALLPEPFNWESYTFTATGGQSWTWDIRCARALASRGPAARRLTLSPDEVHIWLQSHGHVDERHIGHIPLDRLSEPFCSRLSLTNAGT